MKINNTNFTQEQLIIEYFKNNPNRDIKHPEIVDWVVAEYKERMETRRGEDMRRLSER